MQLLKDHNKIALICGTLHVTYCEFMTTVNQIREELETTSFSKAALFAENSPEWAYTLYAVWQSNAINVPIDHLSTDDDVAYILKDCLPEILFCSETTQAVAQQAVQKAGTETRIILLSSLAASNSTGTNTPLTNLTRRLNDTALLIYTSGTTGSPKGVMLSFRNLKTNCDAISDARIFTPEQRILVMLPLHHVLPLLGTLIGALYCGATMVFTPSLSPTDIMDTLQKNAVTMIIGVPRFYALISDNIRAKIASSALARTLYALAKRIHSRRLSRLLFGSVHRKFGGHMQFLVSGGAPLDPAVGECFETLGFSVLEGYGMTETAPMITFPRPDSYKLGACGQALTTNEVRIQNNEIITRGPNVMQGYYNRPDETAAVIKEGWLHTGDLGYFDEDGFLFITGRIKEIIVLPNGKNINPQELEEKLAKTIPELLEVGVFMADNVLQAVLHLREETVAEQPEDQLVSYVRDNLLSRYNAAVSPYKRINRFHLTTTELPRTRMGKVRRFKLQELVDESARCIQRDPDPDTETYQQLASFIKTIVSVPVYADARMDSDLAIDSLGNISLQVFVTESYGLDLTEKDLKENPTLRQLAAFIHQAKTKDAGGTVNWKTILQPSTNLILPRSGMIHRSMIQFTKFLVHLLFRFRVTGRECLPKGPFILAANHQSYIDGLLIAATISTHQMRNTFFYAKEKHVRKRFLKFMAEHNNIIVVDIHNKLKQSVQKLASVLRRGKNVIIFPEGTRTHSGELGDFKPTFAILSSELNIPIVPVAIKGAYTALPKGKRFPRLFSRIEITINPPVQPKNEDYHALCSRVRNIIETDVEASS